MKLATQHKMKRIRKMAGATLRIFLTNLPCRAMSTQMGYLMLLMLSFCRNGCWLFLIQTLLTGKLLISARMIHWMYWIFVGWNKSWLLLNPQRIKSMWRIQKNWKQPLKTQKQAMKLSSQKGNMSTVAIHQRAICSLVQQMGQKKSRLFFVLKTQTNQRFFPALLLLKIMSYPYRATGGKSRI